MSGSVPLRLIVCNDGPSLGAAQGAVVAFLARHDAPGRVASRAELLIEEVALNALRHGHAPDVALTAAFADGVCTLTFEDAGRPFDPLAAALPEAPASLDVAPIGGLGLVLVRKLAATARYERLEGERNRLLLTLAS